MNINPLKYTKAAVANLNNKYKCLGRRGNLNPLYNQFHLNMETDF